MTEMPIEPEALSGAAEPLPASEPASAAERAVKSGADQPMKSAAEPATEIARASSPDATTLGPGDSSLLNLIDRLAGLLERTELTELEVQVGATGLVLRKPSALAPPAPAAAVSGPSTGTGSATDGAAGATTPADAGPPARPAVMAPLSGIWYGAPAPGSAPYVSLGGEVAVGQVIGLIEAMKLFNEIKSDKAGRVARINAEDGKLVRAKQPLIEVDPL
jgi:acetyl-CoA carboxylase biotin carboxyl carrier protein